jgi:hypothetical protein
MQVHAEGICGMLSKTREELERVLRHYPGDVRAVDSR